MWGDIAIAFILAFVVAFVATPYTIKIAKKIGAVDIPKDKRRTHNRTIPRLGGPAVILGFLVVYTNNFFIKRRKDSINSTDRVFLNE